MESIEFDRLTRAMSAVQDRRRALRLAAGVALAGVVGSATIGRSGVVLVLDAEAKKKKKKKTKKKCTTGAAAANQCVSDVNTRCNTKFAADVTNCVASYNGCCDIAISCDFTGAQACLDRSPYQKDPVA